jgi:hypothetical protein
LGLYVLWGRRQARRGGLLLVAGLVWLGLLVLVVIPSISGRAYGFADVNPELGTGPLGLLVGVLDNPLATLRHIVSPPRPEYVVWLLGPLLGLPVLRPLRLLPGLPLFARNLLAAHPSRVWINRHYHAAILPAVLVAAIAALAWLPRRWARRLAVAALAATIAFNGYAVLGLLGTEIPVSAGAEADSYRAALQLIPPDAAVAASNRLGAHLADRRWLWFFPADGDLLGDPSAADWVAVDLADRAAWLREQTDEELYARLRATYPPDQFDEVYQSGSVLVLQRRAGPPPGE